MEKSLVKWVPGIGLQIGWQEVITLTQDNLPLLRKNTLMNASQIHYKISLNASTIIDRIQ